METLILTTDIEPLHSTTTKKVEKFNVLGTLNSSYKKICRSNYKNFKSKSLFGLRSKIKTTQFNPSVVGTIIKLTPFVLLLLLLK